MRFDIPEYFSSILKPIETPKIRISIQDDVLKSEKGGSVSNNEISKITGRIITFGDAFTISTAIWSGTSNTFDARDSEAFDESDLGPGVAVSRSCSGLESVREGKEESDS